MNFEPRRGEDADASWVQDHVRAGEARQRADGDQGRDRDRARHRRCEGNGQEVLASCAKSRARAGAHGARAGTRRLTRLALTRPCEQEHQGPRAAALPVPGWRRRRHHGLGSGASPVRRDARALTLRA